MKKTVPFVKKPRWQIDFVPWSKSPTGVMFSFKEPDETIGDIGVLALSRDESVEFCFDMIKATLERYDVEFSNDIKPPKTKQEVMEKLDNIFEKIVEKARDPYYIR